jgi:type VI secretion system protein ImpK
MRLIDCFSELFYYTLFLKNIGFGQFTHNDVTKHYTKLFKRIALDAKNNSFSRNEIEGALFATAAWVDETVLESVWSGRESWLQYPLQYQLFQTMNAGEEFFIRLSQLDADETSVRQVFGYCLALGFQGKYFRLEDAQTRNDIINDTILRLTGSRTLSFPRLIFPESYAWETEPPPRLARFRSGVLTISILAIVPVIVFACLYLFFKQSLDTLVIEYMQRVFY